MKLNIKELLDFFDDKKDSQKGDANALMAMLGEDLNAPVLEGPVSQGFKKGERLV